MISAPHNYRSIKLIQALDYYTDSLIIIALALSLSPDPLLSITIVTTAVGMVTLYVLPYLVWTAALRAWCLGKLKITAYNIIKIIQVLLTLLLLYSLNFHEHIITICCFFARSICACELTIARRTLLSKSHRTTPYNLRLYALVTLGALISAMLSHFFMLELFPITLLLLLTTTSSWLLSLFLTWHYTIPRRALCSLKRQARKYYALIAPPSIYLLGLAYQSILCATLTAIIILTTLLGIQHDYTSFAILIITCSVSAGIIISSIPHTRYLNTAYITLWATLAGIIITFNLYRHLSTPIAPFVDFEAWLYWMCRLSTDVFLASLVIAYAIRDSINHMLADTTKKTDLKEIIRLNLTGTFILSANFLLVLFILDIITPHQLFCILGIAQIGAFVFACTQYPYYVVKIIVKPILWTLLRVKVTGNIDLKQSPHSSGRIIIANHTSYLDVPLIGSLYPERCCFAINTQVKKVWWIRLSTLLTETFPIEPENALHMRHLIKAIKAGKTCVIFPEGRMTTTGSLMKVYPGIETIIHYTQSEILPIAIEGAHYSRYDRLQSPRTKNSWLPRITIHVGEPYTKHHDLPEQDRTTFCNDLYDLMAQNQVRIRSKRPVFAQLLEAKRHVRANTVICEDHKRQPLTYEQLLLRSCILGHHLHKHIALPQPIGTLLPTSNAAVVTLSALYLYGYYPASLNYTCGITNLITCCKTACLQHIVTSHQFVAAAQLEDMVSSLVQQGLTIHYLEDITASITWLAKTRGWLASHRIHEVYRRHNPYTTLDTPAGLLFTSGSEGTPKCVVLSHRNIVANCMQVRTILDFTLDDILFNALPLFHSFGFTIGTLLPLLTGTKVMLYPNPLHMSKIPERIYDSNATILLGTNALLMGYQRQASDYNFHTLRYVFCGGERLSKQVQSTWFERFGISILEGYGVTESAPVISLNTLLFHKPGSVGRPVPLLHYKLKPLASQPNQYTLWVKGPNVLSGYYLANAPGILQPPQDGWHDTGDVVTMDKQQFITIIGRAKRFAKIAGEMVSLAAVESYCEDLWPDSEHAVITLTTDNSKGESLMLITTQQDATRKMLHTHYKHQHLPEIALPKTITIQADIPKLGNGKIDYITLKNNT